MNRYVVLRNKFQDSLYIIPHGVDINIQPLFPGVMACNNRVIDLLQTRQSLRDNCKFFIKQTFLYDPVKCDKKAAGFITNAGVLS